MAAAILLCGVRSRHTGPVGFGSREIVSSKSTIGVVALMVAVAVLGAGTAFAQTPVVPATTVAGQPDDQTKLDPKDGEDKPKAQTPEAEAPKAQTPEAEAPKADKPKAEKPSAEAPKPEKPKTEAPKAEKPNAKAPKPEKPKTEAPKAEKPDAEAPKADKPGKPRGDKPNPEKSKPAEPKPTTESPNPAQPKRALPGAKSAQPNEPGLEPQVDVAKPVSPTRKAARFVAASPVRHVTTTRSRAAERNRTAARRPASAASRESSGTGSARNGGDSADATPVASGPAAVAPIRAPHLASARDAAGAGASLDRQQPRGLLGGPPRYNLLIPLLLAILYAAGVIYLIRREVRRGLGLGSRRPAPTHRDAPPWPAANGREHVDRQFRRRLLRTRSSRPRARRPAPARLLVPVESKQRSCVTVALRATEHSRRR
jgi:chemotaxis protein histidine kinase CheA